MWRTIYLSILPRLEKKVRVALNWTLDLFFSKDLVQLTNLRFEEDLAAMDGRDKAALGVMA